MGRVSKFNDIVSDLYNLVNKVYLQKQAMLGNLYSLVHRPYSYNMGLYDTNIHDVIKKMESDTEYPIELKNKRINALKNVLKDNPELSNTSVANVIPGHHKYNFEQFSGQIDSPERKIVTQNPYGHGFLHEMQHGKQHSDILKDRSIRGIKPDNLNLLHLEYDANKSILNKLDNKEKADVALSFHTYIDTEKNKNQQHLFEKISRPYNEKHYRANEILNKYFNNKIDDLKNQNIPRADEHDIKRDLMKTKIDMANYYNKSFASPSNLVKGYEQYLSPEEQSKVREYLGKDLKFIKTHFGADAHRYAGKWLRDNFSPYLQNQPKLKTLRPLY